MYKSFRTRLTVTYLVLIVLILGSSGLVLFNTFKNYYLKNAESNLIYEARLVAEMSSPYITKQPEITSLQQICEVAGKDTDTRVTIINKDGKVLADSEYNPVDLDIHNTRPEIYQALRGKVGVEIRYSKTVGTEMIYVAIPVTHQSATGVVRMAKPLIEVEDIYKQIWSVLLTAIIITGFGAFLISLIFANRFARPYKHIIEAVQDIAQGNLKRRIKYRGSDELGILVNAFNDMAEYLDRNMHEISEVNNRLEALLYNTVNGILMVDKDARITYANPAVLSLLGININVCGKKHVEVIRDYELLETIDRVRQEIQPVSKEIVIHNGDEKVIEVNVVPVMDPQQAIYQGVLVVLNDITDIKRLEQVRKDFVANVSHELKTPVTAISGFAETLLEEENNSENVKEFSKIIYDQAQRLSRLVNRLLELSKLESENHQMHIQPININNLIEDTINIVRKRNDCENIAIKFDKENSPVIINGDADIIIQVLINLLDNAIKFSLDEGEITVNIEEQAGEVVISVKDCGTGIPDNEMSRIFERFYRVDKARSRKTGGTGLGLAIAKHLVENHGGRIWAKNNPDKGSTFYFTLPKNNSLT